MQLNITSDKVIETILDVEKQIEEKELGTYGGVSYLDDNGTPGNKADDTWTSFTTGLASLQVYAIAIDSGEGKWIGTQDGVSYLP